MTVTKFSMVAAAALAIVFGVTTIDQINGILASAAHARTIFFDTFDDGDAMDGAPVVWRPTSAFAVATYTVLNQDYVISQPPGGVPLSSAGVAYADILPIGDTSIRAQIRELQGAGSIALVARANADTLTAYSAGIEHSQAYIARHLGGAAPPQDLVTTTFDLNATQKDILLQFDVLGNELKLYAWNADEQKPTSPILSVTDDQYQSGVPGLIVDGTGPHSVAFRYVQVADASIPEPPAAMLSAIFFAGVFAWQWRRSHY